MTYAGRSSAIPIAAVLLAGWLLVGQAPPALANHGGLHIIPTECQYAAIQANSSSCTLCHLGAVVINLTNFLAYYIAFPATVLLIAIGGIMLLIAGPSEERQRKGKEILTATVIGLVIVLLAWLTVDTLIKVLVGPPGSLSATNFIGTFGPWNTFDPNNPPCPI